MRIRREQLDDGLRIMVAVFGGDPAIGQQLSALFVGEESLDHGCYL